MFRIYNNQIPSSVVRIPSSVVRSPYTVFDGRRYTDDGIRSTEYGFTLIELLISVVLVSFLLGAIWMAYNTGLKLFSSQENRSGIKGQAGRFLIGISQELRQASSLTSAQSAGLTFNLDTDNNGVDETVQYSWSGVSAAPLNKIIVSTAPAFTLTTPVISALNSLSVSYYDANNNLLSFPVTASQVRLALIDCSAQDNDETFSLRSQVRLRKL